SRERRSGQTALYVVADGLTRMLAPILTFTADEVWRYLPGARDASVHVAVFPSGPELEAWKDPELMARWVTLTTLRERVLGEIEPLRKDKRIGSSLQAKVILSATPAELALLEQYAPLLPMLFIVSEVQLKAAPTDVEAHAEAMPRIEIARAEGTKCERCWRYVPAVSTEPAWAGLCPRCQDALAEPARG
ncbi:MAG: class I tRNA ligase family protein, partial [Vicinamibacterales bacterium]